jgi:hypothetical protein
VRSRQRDGVQTGCAGAKGCGERGRAEILQCIWGGGATHLRSVLAIPIHECRDGKTTELLLVPLLKELLAAKAGGHGESGTYVVGGEGKGVR